MKSNVIKRFEKQFKSLFSFSYVIFQCAHYVHNKCLVTSDPLESVTPFRFYCVPATFCAQNIISFALFKNIFCIVFMKNFYISLFPIILIFPNVYYVKKMFLTHPCYISIEMCMQVITTPPRNSTHYY